eukprot:jgi/Mesvir1/24853/Mv22089-RA.1
MIVCVAVVGPANNPLYLKTFTDGDESETLKFHYIVHCSLDVVDEKAVLPKKGGSTDTYLGLLYPTEDYKVYGYITNTRAKFMLVVSDADVRETDFKSFFRRMHTLYVDAVFNPFYTSGALLSSPKFDTQIAALVAGYGVGTS